MKHKGRIPAYMLWGLAVLGIGTGVAISIVGGSPSHGGVAAPVSMSIVLTFATVGLLLNIKVPSNRIGWVFLVGGALGGVWVAATTYTEQALVLGWAGLGYAVTASQGVYFPWILSLVALPLLLFPDGQVPTPRWRWVYWYVLGFAGFMAFASGVPLERSMELPDGSVIVVENPIGIEGWPHKPPDAFVPILLAGLAFSLLGPAAAMIARFRRSTGVESLQLKWMAYSAGVAGLALPVFYSFEALASEVPLGIQVVSVVGLLGVLGIPISAGTAITRYRLYDIDRLISRTISYALLVGLLTSVYALGVFVLGDLLPFQGGVPVAVSTLAAAALFNPLRLRLHELIDRRFSRTDYDMERVLAEFGSRVSEEVDSNTLIIELLEVVEETMVPAGSAVWIRDELKHPNRSVSGSWVYRPQETDI